MEITNSNRIIINEIMYSLSIAHPPPFADSNFKSGDYVNGVVDGITAQLLRGNHTAATV